MLTIQSIKQNIFDESKLLNANHWINFTGALSARPNNDLSVYGPFDYIPGLKMTNSNYVSYYDEEGNFITTNLISDVTDYEIPFVTNAKTIKLSLWHSRLKDFKLIKQSQSYPASSIINKKSSVNGEDTLSLSFLFDEINADFIADLDFNWKAKFDGELYTLVNPSIEAITKGRSVTAILSFFTDLNSIYLQDEAEDKSMTALNAYTELFSHTNKRVHLVNSFYSNTLSYQKNQSATERFHYYNERFKVEFVVRGNDVYLYEKIGSYKPDVRIDEDLNVLDAKIEKDTESFFTWCKCYFDLEKSEDGASEENYQKEYVYQNHELIDIYGEIEGPAIYQGNIRELTTMQEYARDVQSNSYSVSHSVSLIDLQRQGYDEFVFHKGDVIRLSLKSINQTIDIRIIDLDETFVENQYGEWERTDLKLTLGNERVVDAYKRSRTDSLIELEEWLSGRKPIPFSILPSAMKRAADIVMGDSDSIMDYRKDRLVGWHSKNEGNNITLNVSGMVLHRDGVPKTAITYEGITADVINTGELNTHNVKIFGAEGFMWMDGNEFVAVNPDDDTQFVRINPKTGLTVSKSNLKILSGNGENAVTVWDSAEGNAKLHADTVAGTAESNAKDHADGVADDLRNDLQMTSPLPNELELSTNGITAYNNSNDRYARLDYRGLFINGGAINIIAHDKRETMIDGIMRGARVANIIHFNSSPEVFFDGMNWNYQSTSPVRTYFTDDQYSGRFFDIIARVALPHDSPVASARVDIRVTEFSGRVIASTNIFVSRSSGESEGTRIRCDLQELFGVVPDYRNVNFYVETQTTVNTSAKIAFRVNKGEWHG